MKSPLRRHWLGALAALGALATFGRSARALLPPIPVVDAARFTEMAVQLGHARQLYNQLVAGLGQLQNAAQRLTDLPDSPSEVLQHYRAITSDVNMVGYRIDTINRQYHRVFPDEAAVRNTPARDVEHLSETWDREVYLSSLSAARAQSSLKGVEGNTRTAAQLLERSEGNSSAVAQLQVLVRMIEVINNDLEQLSVTLAATERVNSSLAATDTSAHAVMAERRRRALDGYSRPAASEGISPEFLRPN